MARKKKKIVVKWGEDEYIIPTISKGRQTPLEDKIEISALVCDLYATNEFTIEAACETCGISARTFNTWTHKISEIADRYEIAQEKRTYRYNIAINQEVKTTIMKLAKGGYKRKLVKDTKIYEMRAVEEGGSEKKPVHVGGTITETEVFIRPSTSLMTFLLEVTEPKTYSKKIVTENSSKSGEVNSFEEFLSKIEIVDTAGEEEAKPLMRSEKEAREYGKQLKPPPFE